MILSIPSFARNIYRNPDPAQLEIDLSKNPIEIVKKLFMGHVTLPKTEFNVVSARSVVFKMLATNQTYSVTIEPDFMSLPDILNALAQKMSSQNLTVNFSTNNSGKVTIQSSSDLMLFPDLPTTSEAIWNYTSTSLISVLGFDLRAPTTVVANTPLTCPNIPNLYGRDYVLMEMRINDVPVGSLYEVGHGAQLFGPFFGKIELNSEPGDVTFSLFNSGAHTFADPVDITKISIEIFGPVIGNKLERYDLNLRDWTMNLIIEKPEDTSIVLPKPEALTPFHLSFNSRDRDVFDRIPKFPTPGPIPPGQSLTADQIREWWTDYSDPSYFQMDFSSNPIKNVRSLTLGDTFVWKTTARRELVWSWFSDAGGMFNVQNIEWYEQGNANALLSRLSAIMSDQNYGGKTVSWSLVNSRATITTNEKLILFTTDPVPTGHFILSHNM